MLTSIDKRKIFHYSEIGSKANTLIILSFSLYSFLLSLLYSPFGKNVLFLVVYLNHPNPNGLLFLYLKSKQKIIMVMDISRFVFQIKL